jgi:hypothetical protein
METMLKQIILTLATVMLLTGILCVVSQATIPVAFIMAATFFLLHKIMMIQEVILAKWKIEAIAEKK